MDGGENKVDEKKVAARPPVFVNVHLRKVYAERRRLQCGRMKLDQAPAQVALSQALVTRAAVLRHDAADATKLLLSRSLSYTKF